MKGFRSLCVKTFVEIGNGRVNLRSQVIPKGAGTLGATGSLGAGDGDGKPTRLQLLRSNPAGQAGVIRNTTGCDDRC